MTKHAWALFALLCACGAPTSCPNLAGNWRVTSHCESSQVGSVWTATQTGCSFSVPQFNFTGIVDSDGAVMVQGTPPGGAPFQNCMGTSSATAVNLLCNDTCGVSLVRQ